MVQDKAANEVLRLFTALFTARDAGVAMGSAAGCGSFLTCFRSHELLARWGRRGGALESQQFCPAKAEVISKPLKDSSIGEFYNRIPSERGSREARMSPCKMEHWCM